MNELRLADNPHGRQQLPIPERTLLGVGPRKPMRQLEDIFGGSTSKIKPGLKGFPNFQVFRTLDNGISARIKTGEKSILASLTNLDHPEQAVRFVALEALRAKAGLSLGQLALETPDTLAAREWIGKREQQKKAELDAITTSAFSFMLQDVARDNIDRKYSYVDSEFGILPGEKSGDSRIDRMFVETDKYMAESEEYIQRSIGQLFAPSDDPTSLSADEYSELANATRAAIPMDLGEFPLKLTVSHIRLKHPTDLPSAANSIAEQTKDMAFWRGSADPRDVIAQALGAPNLEVLGNVWVDAMSARTPKDAAQIALSGLNAHLSSWTSQAKN